MIEYREATVQDVDDLRRIEVACFRDPWTEDMLESEIVLPHSRYVVAVADGQTVGYYAYMHILDEVHILNIAVLPAYQGRGLGRGLMEHLVRNVPSGTVGITLEVRIHNARARHLYEQFGFVSSGVRKGYYMDGEDAVIYWRTEGA